LTTVDFHTIASDAITRGFAVIPLQPGSKDPDFTLVPKVDGKTGTGGACRRTRDWKQIEHWAALSPYANVGVCADSRITILESDNEPQFRQLVRDVSRGMFGESKELPATLTSQARPGRPHFFFLATARTNSIEGAPGIQGLFEWRRENQYVVGPGSLHPTGALYAYTNTAPMVPMPDWLVDVLLEIREAYRGEQSRASKYVRVGPAAIARDALISTYCLDPDAMLADPEFELHVEAGERHYFLQAMAGLLHDGERTADELTDILKRMRDAYCASGKGDYEVENLALWTAKQTPAHIEPNLPSMMAGSTIYRDAAEFRLAEQEWKQGWRRLFHTKAETLAAPPIEFVIDSFLQKDTITMLGGPPAAMKTYAALCIARSLITGEPLFDYFPVNKRSDRVLYLVPESSLGPFAERLKKLDLVRHVGETFFYRTLDAQDPMVGMLQDPRMLEAVRGADVFLDTAVRFMDGLDENKASDQRVFAHQLFNLLKAGARTVTGLHHSPKNFSTQNVMSLENVLRGSGDIGAMLATCWGLSKINDEKSQIYFKCVKDRDFRETPLPFVLEARPHLDEIGKFKMVYSPGAAPDYFGLKQQERGKRGGRPKTEIGAEELESVKGLSERKAAEKLGVSRETLRRSKNPAA
jgi:hypothetical protein